MLRQKHRSWPCAWVESNNAQCFNHFKGSSRKITMKGWELLSHAEYLTYSYHDADNMLM